MWADTRCVAPCPRQTRDAKGFIDLTASHTNACSSPPCPRATNMQAEHAHGNQQAGAFARRPLALHMDAATSVITLEIERIPLQRRPGTARLLPTPPPPPPPSSVTGPANSVSPCTNATRSTSPVASPSSVTATTGQRMWSTDSTPPYRPKTHHLANTCKSRLRRSPLPYIEVDHWQRQTDCSESGRRSRSSRPVALVQCDAWHRGCHASGPKAKRGSTPKC